MMMMVMMMRMTVYEVCGAHFSNVKGGRVAYCELVGLVA